MKEIISRFYQVTIIIVFIVIFVSCSSSLKQNNKVSAQSSEGQVKELKPEWSECEVSTDCVKIKSFCGLPAIAHKKYEDDFLAFVKQNKRSVDCSKYKDMNYGSIVEVVCESKRCRLVIP